MKPLTDEEIVNDQKELYFIVIDNAHKFSEQINFNKYRGDKFCANKLGCARIDEWTWWDNSIVNLGFWPYLGSGITSSVTMHVDDLNSFINAYLKDLGKKVVDDPDSTIDPNE